MTLEQKVVVINATSGNEGVDNLGMALVPNREDVKAIFIDDLPPLFAERVRKILRNEQGIIPYNDYTYGGLIGICTQEGINLCNELKSQLGDFCTQFGLPDTSANRKKIKHRDSRDSNHDKPYRKRRSKHRCRSKEERDERKESKRELAKIKCYKGGNFGHIAPNCKLEKLKTLELEEKVHDKVYSFLYTSGSESDYASDSSSEEDIDLPDLCDNNQRPKVNACNACQGYICSCETDKFYKLQSQFEDLNINTITSTNVIELLKEVTNNNLREKIIQ
ncbi:hypothetical protein H5410_014960 [Solanum commersonii]|uniref:Zinc knuckle family protein n=1 Tax=Solanum commersonii TaxID=4109 RepID=A0A9J5ZSH8_SOLCO|nr:hypothetical protein H5410_014960 [Solanum commersonii]